MELKICPPGLKKSEDKTNGKKQMVTVMAIPFTGVPGVKVDHVKLQ